MRWFHQSRIPSQQIFLTNICYDFFFNWQIEKKKLFWTNKKLFFFFNCSNWEKFVERIWKKLVKTSDELVSNALNMQLHIYKDFFSIFDLKVSKICTYLLKILLVENGNASSDWIGLHCGSYNVVIGRSFKVFFIDSYLNWLMMGFIIVVSKTRSQL